MGVACSYCGSTQVLRRRRQGLVDAFLHVFGRWPFICRACGNTFHSYYRDVPHRPVPVPPVEPKAPEETACFTKRDGAKAAVVIRADSEYQLTNILLALSQAVEAEQTKSKQPRAKDSGKEGSVRSP